MGPQRSAAPRPTALAATQGAADIFTKTKLCKFHLVGGCSRGPGCVFAHSEEELMPLPDLHRTKLCNMYLARGICRDRCCTYAHSKDELRAGSRNRRKQHVDRQARGLVSPTSAFEEAAGTRTPLSSERRGGGKASRRRSNEQPGKREADGKGVWEHPETGVVLCVGVQEYLQSAQSPHETYQEYHSQIVRPGLITVQKEVALPPWAEAPAKESAVDEKSRRVGSGDSTDCSEQGPGADLDESGRVSLESQVKYLSDMFPATHVFVHNTFFNFEVLPRPMETVGLKRVASSGGRLEA